MINASVIGASGYSGIYIIYNLSSRKDVEIKHITSRQYAGKYLNDIFPSFYKFGSLIFEEYDEDVIAKSSDVVFLCLPHGESSRLAAGLVSKNKHIKLIDIAADFRFSDIATYEASYEKHSAAQLNNLFIYGLADIFQDKIKNAQFVANPGCYPAGALIPLLPLFLMSAIDLNFPVIIDSKSGISGAGKSLNIPNLFCEAESSIRAYSVWTHRHLPEIKEKIYQAAENKPLPEIIFTPHVIPSVRGLLTTIYLRLKKGVGEKDAESIYHKFFDKSPFVSLLENGGLPDTKNVIYSNNCHIAIREKNGYFILISAIDNLGKGASLQAVQNMNLMFGIEAGQGINKYSPYP